MSVAIDLAVAAVLVDSAVTAAVGRALITAAHREATRAAESVRPALDDAVDQALARVVPVLLAIGVEPPGGAAPIPRRGDDDPVDL